MKKLRVLLVDDEIMIREGFKKLFDWEAHECVVVGEAADGMEAITKIDEEQPDIVIMDINIPIINGLKVIQLSRVKYPSMAFVIVSGYDDFSYCREALRLQITDYILKPVNYEEFGSCIDRLKISLYNNEVKEKPVVKKERVITGITKYMQEHLSEDVSLHILSEEFHLNSQYICRSGLRSLLLLVGVSGDSHLDLVDSGFPIDRNELIVVHAQGDFRRQTLHVDVYGRCVLRLVQLLLEVRFAHLRHEVGNRRRAAVAGGAHGEVRPVVDAACKQCLHLVQRVCRLEILRRVEHRDQVFRVVGFGQALQHDDRFSEEFDVARGVVLILRAAVPDVCTGDEYAVRIVEEEVGVDHFVLGRVAVFQVASGRARGVRVGDVDSQIGFPVE